MGTGFWYIYGVGMIIGATGAGVWQVIKLIAQRQLSPRPLFLMVTLLYPLGVGCKVAFIGPEFMRFHLSDIGFPLFLSYALSELLWLAFQKKHPEQLKNAHWTDATLLFLKPRRRAVIIALLLSYLYEVATGIMYWLKPLEASEVGLVGNFDWVDMMMYSTGAGVGLLILAWWRRGVMIESELHSAAQKAQVAAERRRRSARKTPRSKRKRRG